MGSLGERKSIGQSRLKVVGINLCTTQRGDLINSNDGIASDHSQQRQNAEDRDETDRLFEQKERRHDAN